MDCRQTRKLITPFIEDKLKERELKDFIDHIGQCPECKEELSIQFLVTEGLSQLEESSSFDIQGRLEEKLKKGRRSFLAGKRMIWLMYLCEIAAILAVTIMVAILIFK